VQRARIRIDEHREIGACADVRLIGDRVRNLPDRLSESVISINADAGLNSRVRQQETPIHPTQQEVALFLRSRQAHRTSRISAGYG
jgi:hypothetical protein